jgi:hypothetical protein
MKRTEREGRYPASGGQVFGEGCAWRGAVAKVLCAGVLLAAHAAQAGEIHTAELAFQHQVLDLDTGTVIEVVTPMEAGGGDVTLAYNALRPTRAVVIPAAGAELVLFEGLAFDGVSSELVADLLFSAEPVDVAFGADVTVVVRTASGAVYKLGNAAESAAGVTFNFAAL